MLLDSRRILIPILGEAKLGTYAAACGSGPVEEMLAALHMNPDIALLGAARSGIMVAPAASK